MFDTEERAPFRVHAGGKFLRLGDRKYYVKGLSYGPFEPNGDGEPLPDRQRVRSDFAQIRSLGGNTLRVYYPPPEWLLDAASDHDLRVFIDVPWEKHRCFFEDWAAMEEARKRVRETARHQGRHPAVFAISVVNEFPVDVVRFYGRQRMEKFVSELLDNVKQEAPDCLGTFVNYPTTEFLNPEGSDFCCFNVYLHDMQKLGGYLDRLQHIAGDQPLILGEYGIDSIREGEDEQARIVSQHVQQVFRHGLAGSFVFAYTDDWYTSGRQIDDWAFGVTRDDRSEKLVATGLRGIWSQVPQVRHEDQPRVSVVVCSYNGGTTLRDCLDSLMQLDYPDYEVILVDDGSTDNTAEIAADFPQVIYHRQENRGLSVARNVGADLASGEIVAYTDDDCVVDEHWLAYLVQAMHDQQVQAIGGPNITPHDDGWVSKCVAASPGNPSHVMLDDRHAEHVPGCNMAFRRDTLLGIGGFDPQFRVAGDDVDICWRLLDAKLPIGYAPGAMVWHHRRTTVSAYAKQQQGYGRSEAMVRFKHPQRFRPSGRSRWKGVIYGDGAIGLPVPDIIYHGRFGSGLFQTIYRQNNCGLCGYVLSLEWHLLAFFLLSLGLLAWPLALISLGMWSATLGFAVRRAQQAHLPPGGPWWCRPLVAYLYLLQPLARGWHRLKHLLGNMKLPGPGSEPPDQRPPVKRISFKQHDLYWESHAPLGREQLLETLIEEANREGWSGDFDNGWADWDVKLVGDRWHDITIRTATEQLAWPNRFTRARCTARPTLFSRVAATATLVWSALALVTLQPWALLIGLVAASLVFVSIGTSRRRCLRAATTLVARAARICGLTPVGADGTKRPRQRSRRARPIPDSWFRRRVARPARDADPQEAKTVSDDSGIVHV